MSSVACHHCVKREHLTFRLTVKDSVKSGLMSNYMTVCINVVTVTEIPIQILPFIDDDDFLVVLFSAESPSNFIYINTA